MPVNPADSPILGTLYGSDAMRAVFDETAFFQRMLDVEAALARVQGRMGIIPDDAAEAIIAAAKIENLSLSKAAGAAGGWTHWGATTQDIMDTATVLQVREGLDLIENELLAVLSALAGQAEMHRNTVMAGRTHLQQALPVTFGLKCAIWAMPFLAHRERLGQLRGRVLTVEFAGAAGTLA
jgi:3-carboxy-cis,cis-muconate cycloisomerase